MTAVRVPGIGENYYFVFSTEILPADKQKLRCKCKVQLYSTRKGDEFSWIRNGATRHLFWAEEFC